MWAFIGEPGAEHRETIATATMAAAAGGITTVLARPDTIPPVDEAAVVDFLQRRARDTGRVRVLPMAALTAGLDGAEIAEIGLLQLAARCLQRWRAGDPQHARVMRRVMQYARDFDALDHALHAEDRDLAGERRDERRRVARRASASAELPREAEAIMLDRDIRLVALTGARYHAALISTALSLDIIAKAKADGLAVTCGTSINHLALNENDIGDYRTFLETRAAAAPRRRAAARSSRLWPTGSIDVVVSDHNPQDVETKRLPFAEAEDRRASGWRRCCPAGLRLVHSGEIAAARDLHCRHDHPAGRGPSVCHRKEKFEVGAPADLYHPLRPRRALCGRPIAALPSAAKTCPSTRRAWRAR